MIESEKTHFTKVYSFSRLWYGHQELLVQMNREEGSVCTLSNTPEFR